MQATKLVQDLIAKYKRSFKNGADWSLLTAVLETPIAKISLLAPVVGQTLIYFTDEGGWFKTFISDGLGITTLGSYILYWSLIFVASARAGYMWACPKAIKTYKTIDDYITVKRQTLAYSELVSAWEIVLNRKVNRLDCRIDQSAISDLHGDGDANTLKNNIHQMIWEERYPKHGAQYTEKKFIGQNKRNELTHLMSELLYVVNTTQRDVILEDVERLDSYVPLPRNGAEPNDSFVLASTYGREMFHQILKQPDSDAMLYELGYNASTDDSLSTTQKGELKELYDFIERGRNPEQWQRDAVTHLWNQENIENQVWRIWITRLLLTLPFLYFFSKALVTILHVGWLTAKLLLDWT